ncbi:MAG: penicillin acylase family protein, partial [Gemmatimonadales bacterium]
MPRLPAALLASLLAVFATPPSAEDFDQLARAALPNLDGRVRVPGLHDSVELIRDRWGVPHLYASNLDDLFFAQGYVQAQDRLWQMDLYR